MNKQEVIEEIEKIRNNIEWIEPKEAIAFRRCLNIIEQLDEPSREECDYFTAPYNYGESTDIDYNICNICRYHEKCDDKFKSNFDVWNYCPNCGAKIKREKRDE